MSSEVPSATLSGSDAAANGPPTGGGAPSLDAVALRHILLIVDEGVLAHNTPRVLLQPCLTRAWVPHVLAQHAKRWALTSRSCLAVSASTKV